MALERFFEYYQPGENLPNQVFSDQEKMGNSDHPLIFLTDRLVNTARDEIRSLSDQYDLSPTPEAGVFLFDETMFQSAAIVFGTVLKGLMEWSQTGIFEHDVLISRLNNTTVGTPLSSFKKPQWLENDRERVPVNKTLAMRNAIKNDPTFAIFFKDPKYMPNDLKHYLDDMHIFEYQPLKILTKQWSETAGSVMGIEPKTQEMTPKKELKLNPLADSQLIDILNRLDF